MAGKGGGAWKVAYADFVTAMMAFFLVMWIVAQNKPIREAVAQYFRDPAGSGGKSPIPGKGDSMLPLKDAGPSPLDKNPFNSSRSRGAQAVAGPGGDEDEPTAVKTSRISVAADESSTTGTQVPFDEDSPELDEQGRVALDRLLPALLGKMSKLELRGHASARRSNPDSPFKDAWELSYARALSVMKYLVEKGVDVRRIRLSQSGANEQNVTSNSDGRVQNARVEVYVLNEVITDPSAASQRRNERAKKVPKRPARPKLPTQENAE